MKIHHITVALLSLIGSNGLIAQNSFSLASQVDVRANGKILSNPFQGGFNAPQFNQMDLNQDNKMDLFIFDRSGNRISTYINNGTSNQINYNYDPIYIDAFPEITDWVASRDYDCDGKMDLFIQSGSSIKVYRNISSATNGLRFQYISRVSSDYGSTNFNINPGSQNYPAIGDLNSDGDIDFLFFDQNGSQIELHKNVSKEQNNSCGLTFVRRSTCWGDFTEAGFNSTIFLDSCRFGNIPPNPESGDDPVRNLGKSGTIHNNKHAGSSVALFDLDGDGNSDLLLGDIGSNNLTALFNNDSIAPYIDSHVDSIDQTFPSYNVPVDLPLFPAPFFLDVNNDGKEDLIVSTNSNSYIDITSYNNHILFYENTSTTAAPNFNFRKRNFLLEEVIDLGRGNYPSFFDYNNDGLQDILVGNFGNIDTALNLVVSKLTLFENIGTALNPLFQLVDSNYADVSSYALDFNNNQAQKNLVPTLGDLDGDGDEDLLLGDENGNIHFFEDTSSTANNAAFNLNTAAYQKINVFGSAAPQLVDFDEDGLLDLVVGNDQGELEYHQNLGDSLNPIFNIEIQSITWQSGSTIRYQLEGNPDLSKLQVGQTIQVKNAISGDNNVPQVIAVINTASNYLDLTHPFRNSSLDDETNTPAVIDYSIKRWGGIQLTNFNFNRKAHPFLYKDDQNEWKLLVGSQRGEIYQYDSIRDQAQVLFPMIDSNLLGRNLGYTTAISGTDINNDNIIDLIIGNEAGGFTLYFGSMSTNIANNQNLLDENDELLIYPNPTKQNFTIEVPNRFRENSIIKIYSIRGKLIWENRIVSNRTIIHDLNLGKGMYVINIQNDTERISKKLLIQ